MKPSSTLRHFLLLAGSSLLALSSASAATYYWDDNAAGSGFGTAGESTGTWAAPTAGPTAGWSLSSTGANAFASFTTANDDTLNFGTDTVGLGAGTITVSGTVVGRTMTFGAASGNITISGDPINLNDSGSRRGSTFTVNNELVTISSNLVGYTLGTNTGITKQGSGMLVLSGDNSGYRNSATNINAQTTINGGVLKIAAANALPAGYVALNGGVLGLTTATGDFSRNLGTTANSGSTIVSLGGGGFAAYGGDRNVTLNGGSTVLNWGSTTGFGSSQVVLGHATADSKLTLNATINLTGGAAPVTRTIQVNDGSAEDSPVNGTFATVVRSVSCMWAQAGC